MVFMETIGKRIRKQRKESGLKQKEFAQLLGVHVNSVGMWETDKTEPSLVVAGDIARVLKCSVEWLIYGDESLFMTSRPRGVRQSIDLSNAQGVAVSHVFGDGDIKNSGNVKQVSEPTAKYSTNKSSNFLTLINELENLNEKDLAIVIGLVKSIKEQK